MKVIRSLVAGSIPMNSALAIASSLAPAPVPSSPRSANASTTPSPSVTLSIIGHHNYAVGDVGVLVHNESICDETIADELRIGQRLDQLLGKVLRESPHVGAEYIDDLGRAYDALCGFH